MAHTHDLWRSPKGVVELAEALHRLVNRRFRIMEVCGTHTMSIARAGLRQLLPSGLELISGPGCPVCVTDQADLDWALALADLPQVTIASFGDLLRVPGDHGSLAERRAQGSDVRVVYSIMDALALAERLPDREVVFVAIGFETTAPGIAAGLMEARRRSLRNFSIIPLLKTMPRALELLLGEETAIDAFLLPGHVCAVTGLQPFGFIADRYQRSAAIAGFEPVEILGSIAQLVEYQRPTIANLYPRVVRDEGNPTAQAIIQRVFIPQDARWRGLGALEGSGLGLRDDWQEFDAWKRFNLARPRPSQINGCRCGDILRGRLRPTDCALFGKACRPEAPTGPCMVSSEGPCAAEYRYGSIIAP